MRFLMYTGVSDKLKTAGLISISVTLFLISLPRSWSLYPLGLFLFIGLVLWMTNFRDNYLHLKKHILLVLPPIMYFIVHFLSVMSQNGPVNLLEDRLMFLLIPLFGFPLFIQYSPGDKLKLFKAFIAGIILVSIILIVRIILFVHNLVPEDMSFFEYSKLHKYWYFSAHVSVFENPTYFTMKIMWVLLIFIFFHDKLKIGMVPLIIISAFLGIFLYFIASRASIIFWLFTLVLFLFRLYRKGFIKLATIAVIIPVMIILAGISVKKIPRINESLTDLTEKLNRKDVDWKNLDQRTREWYTAVQIIRESPLTGAGMAKIKERLKSEYLKNGFIDEAESVFNAHNQFLEAQMTFGVAGTFSIIWLLLTPLFLRRRSGYIDFIPVFVIMVSYYLMFESMLNRQWGIMFFLLFYFILCTPKCSLNSYRQPLP